MRRSEGALHRVSAGVACKAAPTAPAPSSSQAGRGTPRHVEPRAMDRMEMRETQQEKSRGSQDSLFPFLGKRQEFLGGTGSIDRPGEGVPEWN